MKTNWIVRFANVGQINNLKKADQTVGGRVYFKSLWATGFDKEKKVRVRVKKGGMGMLHNRDIFVTLHLVSNNDIYYKAENQLNFSKMPPSKTLFDLQPYPDIM